MAYTVEVVGGTELRAKLRQLGDTALTHEALFRVGRWAEATLKGKPAPPERSGQKYRRTGQLNYKWRAVISASDQVKIINDASGPSGFYPEFVVGEKQSWQHEGRWWIATEVVEEIIPKALEEVGQWVEAIWNG